MRVNDGNDKSRFTLREVQIASTKKMPAGMRYLIHFYLSDWQRFKGRNTSY